MQEGERGGRGREGGREGGEKRGEDGGRERTFIRPFQFTANTTTSVSNGHHGTNTFPDQLGPGVVTTLREMAVFNNDQRMILVIPISYHTVIITHAIYGHALDKVPCHFSHKGSGAVVSSCA